MMAWNSMRTFDDWYKSVGHIIETRTGLDIDDLPDCPYEDWWEDGVTASVAATRAIKRANDDDSDTRV